MLPDWPVFIAVAVACVLGWRQYRSGILGEEVEA